MGHHPPPANMERYKDLALPPLPLHPIKRAGAQHGRPTVQHPPPSQFKFVPQQMAQVVRGPSLHSNHAHLSRTPTIKSMTGSFASATNYSRPTFRAQAPPMPVPNKAIQFVPVPKKGTPSMWGRDSIKMTRTQHQATQVANQKRLQAKMAATQPRNPCMKAYQGNPFPVAPAGTYRNFTPKPQKPLPPPPPPPEPQVMPKQRVYNMHAPDGRRIGSPPRQDQSMKTMYPGKVARMEKRYVAPKGKAVPKVAGRKQKGQGGGGCVVM